MTCQLQQLELSDQEVWDPPVHHTHAFPSVHASLSAHASPSVHLFLPQCAAHVFPAMCVFPAVHASPGALHVCLPRCACLSQCVSVPPPVHHTCLPCCACLPWCAACVPSLLCMPPLAAFNDTGLQVFEAYCLQVVVTKLHCLCRGKSVKVWWL